MFRLVLKYRLWRATILAELRKHAPSYESLWGKGGENALRPA
jgi:hypothetical protein